MLKIKLQAEFERLKVTEYEIFYPASIYINKKSQKEVHYTVSVLNCKNIQGSFLLYYARKKVLSAIQQDSAEINIVGGTLSNSVNVQIDDDDTALQYLVFKKRLLLYANENDSRVIFFSLCQSFEILAKSNGLYISSLFFKFTT